MTIRRLVEDLVNSSCGNLDKEVRFYHPDYCEAKVDYYDYADQIESIHPGFVTVILKD